MNILIIAFDIIIWVGMAHAFWLQVSNYKNSETATEKTFGAIMNFGFAFLTYGTIQLFQDAGSEISIIKSFIDTYSDWILITDRLLLFILTVICVRFNSGKYAN